MLQRTCANCGKEFYIQSVKDYLYKRAVKDKETGKHTTKIYCCRSCMKIDMENAKIYRSVK